MSEIFIIAGPPGIGKSSNGPDYIDPNFDTLNEDDIKLKYKNNTSILYLLCAPQAFYRIDHCGFNRLKAYSE